MKYKIYAPLTRQQNTQALYVAATGNVMSTIIPHCETRGEMVLYKYTDDLKIPSFRVETENFCTIDIHPTSVKLYFPFEQHYEVIEIKCDRVVVPVYFKAPDERPVCHAVITDVGHLWLIHHEYSTADLIYFMSTASTERGDQAIHPSERTCLGHVRNAHLISRTDRILTVIKQHNESNGRLEDIYA